jgi:hypothetical protein
LEEIDLASQTGNVYFSRRFNEAGKAKWVSLLRQAAQEHNEHWLAYQIEAHRLMKDYEHAQKQLGGYTIKHVPHTAAETLAEGQFNRFYIIAVCRLALEQGKKTVTIYRAKGRVEHRPESDALIGTQESADCLIKELRFVQESLNHKLLRPNSGLSVQLP